MWHHCSDKLEQSPRVVLDDHSSTYDYLLHTLDIITLKQKRVQDMLVTIYKCALISRSATQQAPNLRGYAKLNVLAVKTTTLALHSFRHQAPHVWNNLPDEVRRADTFTVLSRKWNNFLVLFFVI